MLTVDSYHHSPLALTAEAFDNITMPKDVYIYMFIYLYISVDFSVGNNYFHNLIIHRGHLSSIRYTFCL